MMLDIFLITNQTHKLSQFYSVIKLYMFWASSLPIIRNSLLYIRHWYFHAGFWWPLPNRVRMEPVPSWLCSEMVIRDLHETYQCWMYSRKLL